VGQHYSARIGALPEASQRDRSRALLPRNRTYAAAHHCANSAVCPDWSNPNRAGSFPSRRECADRWP